MKKKAFHFICISAFAFALNTGNKILSEKQIKAEEKPAQSRVKPEEETVNLQTEMNIVDLIRTVSEVTGEIFLLDESVKAKNTRIITPQGKFKKQNIVKLFEAILDLNGFAMVKVDGINKIIPKRDIKRESLPVEIGTE